MKNFSIHNQLNFLKTNQILYFIGLILIVLSLFRTSLHFDEARYLTIAWEMGLRGEYWVPHLNGVAYSHKPPLLFWITNLIWTLTQPQLWSARLVPILFTLLTGSLLAPIFGLLFPNLDKKEHNNLVLFFFLSNFVVIGMSLLYMFDTLMMFWVTLGWYISLRYAQSSSYALRQGLVLGLGVLTKGPVICVYLLSLVSIQHLLQDSPKEDLKLWIRNQLKAICIATCIGLTWAIIAAIKGGHDYGLTLIWKQTMYRLKASPFHPRPWWFYPSIIPILFLPWVFVPKFFTSPLKKLKVMWRDVNTKIMILWVLSVFGIFQIISCKQPQYLLPLLPALTILGARFYLLDEKSNIKHPRIMMFCSYIFFVILIYPINSLLEKRLPIHAITDLVSPYPDRLIAMTTNRYRGELGFAARRPYIWDLDDSTKIKGWLDKYWGGLVLAYIPKNQLINFGAYYLNNYRIIGFRKTKRDFILLIEKDIFDFTQIYKHMDFQRFMQLRDGMESIHKICQQMQPLPELRAFSTNKPHIGQLFPLWRA